MTLTLNGEKKNFPEPLLASDLLECLGVSSERVIMQLNLKVLKRDQLCSTRLNDGDVVEIIHIVGGG